MRRSALARSLLACWLLPVVVGLVSPARAVDLRRLFPGRVEADPQKAYELTQEQGPWLVMCASFSGPGAEQQARELLMELRSKHNLPAYQHRQNYDFTDSVEGLGINQYAQPKKMRYKHAYEFTEIAVLVGNFETIDAPNATKTRDLIKHLRPASLDFNSRGGSTQRYVGFRDYLWRHIDGREASREKGPMGSAFMTRNPLLPAEYFAPGGIDSLVLRMNQEVEHSLLKNPRRYTVKVATFRGDSTFDASRADAPIRSGNQPSRLEIAADKAHFLTTALRKKGVEAWEFHDRYESIVAIGGFDEIEQTGAQGETIITPGILAIMQTYAPRPTTLGNGVQTIQPFAMQGIAFDMQPEPIEVPRASIAGDYARTLRR